MTALGKHEGEEVPIHGNPFEVNVYNPKEVLLDRDQEQTTLALGTDYAFEGTSIGLVIRYVEVYACQF